MAGRSKSLNRTQLVAGCILLLCFALAAWSLTRASEMRPNASLRELLYVQSPKSVHRLGLGYDGLMAAVYWTRAVQYFGRQHNLENADLSLLHPLLNITTELDPKMIVAYEFGSTFLAQRPPWGAGEPDKAVELVKRGIERNPDNWRLYYQLGFIEYLERKDYAAAAKAFLEGSKLPGAHPWMRVMAAQMEQQGGSLKTAEMMWRSIAETTEDENIRKNAILRLTALKIEYEIMQLQQIIDQYRANTGREPESMQELVRAGYLRYVPADPAGAPYAIWKGQAITESPDWWRFITRGVPPKEYDAYYLQKKASKQ